MPDPTATAQRTAQWLGLLAGPIIAIIVFVLLPAQYTDAEGVSTEFTAAGRMTFAVMILMGVWWLTEAIDITITALLPLALFPLLNIAPIRQAAAPYADQIIFLFMGGFLLALSMQKWGLDRRIALITLRLFGTKPINMIAGIMAATALISAFVSNTATAAMMLPIGMSIVGLSVGRNEPQPDENTSTAPDSRRPAFARSLDNFSLCMMLGIAYAASIGGIATIIGTPPNAFLVGFLRDSTDPAYRMEMSFLKWLAIGAPLALLLLPIAWLLLTRVLYPVANDPIAGGDELIRRYIRELGRPNRGQTITFIVFLITAVLWMFRPAIVSFSYTTGDGAKLAPFVLLNDATIVMLAAIVLFLWPVNRTNREFVLDWPTAARLPWGILILFGGGLSLADAIQSTGVAAFLAAQTASLHGLPDVLLVLIIVAAVVFASELMSNTAMTATLVPILAALAPGLGVHPYTLIIPAALAASTAFMLPVGTPPNAMVFATGHVTVRQMCKAGFWLNLISILIITVLTIVIINPMCVAGH